MTDEGRDDRLVCQLWLSKRSLKHSEGVVFMLSCYGYSLSLVTILKTSQMQIRVLIILTFLHF